MKRTRQKSFYDYRGYQGPDIDIETSLVEYGLIWKCTSKRKGEYRIIYGIANEGINCEYTRFAYAFINWKDWQELCNEDWFKIDSVCDYASMTKEEFIGTKESFIFSLDTAISYWGRLEILGDCYSKGFKIGKVC